MTHHRARPLGRLTVKPLSSEWLGLQGRSARSCLRLAVPGPRLSLYLLLTNWGIGEEHCPIWAAGMRAQRELAHEAVMPGTRGPGLGEAVDDLTAIAPDRCAALVAPQIERLTFAVIHASVKRAGPQLVAYGVPPEAIDIVGQLRTGLAARPVSAAGLAAVYRYRGADQLRRNLDTLAGAGIIERAGDGAIRATDAGRALLALMYASGAEAAAGLWSGNRAAAGLSELAGRLVVAAVASGGDAYAAVAPPY